MPQTFRLDIEGLRGVAILLVVFYHAGLPGFSGGYVGVDVFFALSGYLITGLLVKEIEGTGGLRLARFYGRRVRRLLPAAALSLLVTCLAGYYLLTPIEQMNLQKSAAATAAYASNLYFARASTDYLGRGAEANPFLHTWSLSVEEQFYFVWPLLVLLALRGGRRRLVAMMGAIFVSTLALSAWLTHVKQPWAFFLSPPRAWEFAAGGLCALLARETRLTPLVRWAGLGAILCAALAFTRQTAFPGVAALLPVAGTLMVLHAGDPSRGAGRLLGASPLRLIGRFSYSWYLWHWPALVVAASLWGELSRGARGACLLFSLALAWATYHTVENPVRRSRRLAARPSRLLAMAAWLTLAGLGAGLAWRVALARALASPGQAKLARAATDRPEVYGGECFAGFYDTSPHECVFGEGKTVVLLGDSHAAQWLPALRGLEGWRVLTLLKAACAAPDVSYTYPTIGRRYTECEEWRAKALDVVAGLRPDAVVVASSQAYVPGLVSAREWEAGTRRTLTKLVGSGARVYLLRDTPRPDFDVPSCLSRAAWTPWLRARGCGFGRERGLREDVRRAEEAAAAASGARYLDLTALVCPGSRCEPEADDQVIYADSNHLTATFAAGLSNDFGEALNGR